MKVGVIADVHGNSVALDAVLVDVAQENVDLAVCLGDLAANGPDPTGAIDRIAELSCPVAVGNTDIDLIEMPDWWHDPAAVGAPESARHVAEISRWCAEQLDDHHKEFLAGLPLTIETSLGDAGSLLGFHGSPKSATDIITSTTAADELDAMFSGFDQAILAGGHTHVAMIRRHRGQTIVNPGSVGLPFAGYGFVGEVAVLNHAAYALVTVIGQEIDIELRQIPVDPSRLTTQVAASGMPHSQWWLSLRP